MLVADREADRLNPSDASDESDVRNEKINYKVREHALAKVPVLFVVGKREAEEKTVSIRRHGQQDQEVLPLDKAVNAIAAAAAPPD